MKPESDKVIPEKLAVALQSARHVAVLAGSGISAESGVPTFREAQTGLWAQYDAQELATPQAFQRNPRLVWEWYEWRRTLVARAQPNQAHRALADLESCVPQLTLITQNVDGLHQRGGSPKVIELHGNIGRTKCFSEDVIVESWPETNDVPPHCPRCEGLLRPDVVWFGEPLSEEALAAAITAARSCDLFFSIGTSAVVQPAASLALEALHDGAKLVEINLERTPLTPYATHSLKGRAGRLLPALVQASFR